MPRSIEDTTIEVSQAKSKWSIKFVLIKMSMMETIRFVMPTLPNRNSWFDRQMTRRTKERGRCIARPSLVTVSMLRTTLLPDRFVLLLQIYQKRNRSKQMLRWTND